MSLPFVPDFKYKNIKFYFFFVSPLLFFYFLRFSIHFGFFFLSFFLHSSISDLDFGTANVVSNCRFFYFQRHEWFRRKKKSWILIPIPDSEFRMQSDVMHIAYSKRKRKKKNKCHICWLNIFECIWRRWFDIETQIEFSTPFFLLFSLYSELRYHDRDFIFGINGLRDMVNSTIFAVFIFV